MFRRLIAYLDSIKARDPAPRSRWEILLYPGVHALGWHRLAHALFRARLFFLARAVNHLSRFLTTRLSHRRLARDLAPRAFRSSWRSPSSA